MEMIARRLSAPKGVNRYLGPDEQVALSCRRHPIVLVKPITIWLGVLVAVTVAGMLLSGRLPGPWADRILAVLALGATAYAIVKVLVWSSTRYLITDQRVLLIQGLASKKVAATPLSKINDTTFTRSLLGRILGYGDLTLESAGERSGLSDLAFLPRAPEVYRLLTSLLSQARPIPPAGYRGQPGSHWDPHGDETGRIPR